MITRTRQIGNHEVVKWSSEWAWMLWFCFMAMFQRPFILTVQLSLRVSLLACLLSYVQETRGKTGPGWTSEDEQWLIEMLLSLCEIIMYPSFKTFVHLSLVLSFVIEYKFVWTIKWKKVLIKILPLWLSLTLGTLCLMLAPKGRLTNSISPTNGTSGWDGTFILFSLQL